MATYNKETYNVNTLYGGVPQFQQVAELANAQYDTAQWRKFASWGRTFRTPKWNGSITNAGIAIAAAVLSTNGQKPPRPQAGFGKYQGNIPMIGHMFNITADDIMTLRELEADNEDPRSLQQFQYTSRFYEHVRGMHNRINMFVHQGLSTGYITADQQNNQEGVQNVLIDLGMRPENRLFPTKVWSDPTADPIKDILAWQDKFSEDPNAPVITDILMSKALVKMLAEHPMVRKAIALKKYIGSPIPDQIPLTRMEVITGMTEYFDILPITIIDEKARVQEDGMWKEVKSFETNSVVFCRIGTGNNTFFEMVHCRNIYDDDTNPNVAKVRFEGGRFTAIVEHFSNPFNIATSMEAFVCPVPRNVNNWYVAKIDTTAPWGSRDTMLDRRFNAVKTVKDFEHVIVNGEEFMRLEVINALNAMTPPQTTGLNMKLSNVQAKVDALSADLQKQLFTALTAE
jgi:hypothetical protein